MPELDTLRGLAILGVVFLHGFSNSFGARLHFSKPAQFFITLTQPGWAGVNLFFVLSGFLITGILLESKSSARYYRSFYIRRALRILPACYLLLLVLYFLKMSSLGFVLLGFFYLTNLADFFGIVNGYGVLWSLAVEEHFYIFWPLVARRVSARNLAYVSLGIIILSPFCRGVAFYLGHPRGIDWYTWFVLDGLATGSLLAIVLRSRIRREEVARLATCLIGVAVLAAATGAHFGILTRTRALGAALQFSLLHLLFAGILLLVLMAGSGKHPGAVNSQFLQFYGYISYGLYLIHMLVFHLYDRINKRFFPELQPASGRFDLVVIRFVAVFCVATGIALVSRRYYEEKFLRLKERLAPEEPEIHHDESNRRRRLAATEVG